MSGLHFQEHVSMKDHTTFRVGGHARYFVVVKSVQDILEALEFAKKKDIPYLILGGGSNIIVADAGYKGLIIKLDFTELHYFGTKLEVGSSYVLNDLVTDSINYGLAGLEWAGGLPGTVGGGIRGNAGAFGGEIQDVISSVTAVNRQGEVIIYDKQECAFDYRSSYFKRRPEIIIQAVFALKKGNKETLKKIADEHRKYRKTNHPMSLPSAGSIFKNIPVQNIPEEFRHLFSDAQKNDPFPVIPTARILSDAGLKGYQIGKAQISNKHPNYIVNVGGAKARDIVELINFTVNRIHELFRIRLEVEPQLVGFPHLYPWESK